MTGLVDWGTLLITIEPFSRGSAGPAAERIHAGERLLLPSRVRYMVSAVISESSSLLLLLTPLWAALLSLSRLLSWLALGNRSERKVRAASAVSNRPAPLRLENWPPREHVVSQPALTRTCTCYHSHIRLYLSRSRYTQTGRQNDAGKIRASERSRSDECGSGRQTPRNLRLVRDDRGRERANRVGERAA